ncbi:MAG: hypothetical protein OEV94_02785 [Deltaproteobacteria bacterium]|nr:hypothetical protein [Deltaproteobacteria bacterium]
MTSSRNPWNSLPPAERPGMAPAGEDHTPRLEAWLAALMADTPRHAKFLNTLALLEHLGSRKIMLSQSGPAMPLAALQHLAEETGHAFFFRRAAEALLVAQPPKPARAFDWSPRHTMAPQAGAMYLARLEALVVRLVGLTPPALPYLYTSALVEVRALWFFHLYQRVLKQQGAALNLKKIIGEEDGHLMDMTFALHQLDRDFSQRFETLKAGEARAFAKLLPKVMEG